MPEEEEAVLTYIDGLIGELLKLMQNEVLRTFTN